MQGLGNSDEQLTQFLTEHTIPGYNPDDTNQVIEKLMVPVVRESGIAEKDQEIDIASHDFKLEETYHPPYSLAYIYALAVARCEAIADPVREALNQLTKDIYLGEEADVVSKIVRDFNDRVGTKEEFAKLLAVKMQQIITGTIESKVD